MRRSRLLALGLAAAALVLMQGQLRAALDSLHAWESRVGLSLVPAAVLLAVVLLLFFQARRQDERLDRAVEAAARRERGDRDADLENLAQFGLALARAGDMGALRDVAHQMLPRFIGKRAVWAVVRAKGQWESLVGGLDESSSKSEVEKQADQALNRFEGSTGEPERFERDGRIYFPLVVGDSTTGVLAVDTGDDGGDIWKRAVGSAATLIAIAAQNVQLTREVKENAVYDGLTGCFNRTHSMRVLHTELQRARRQQAPLALIMLDLDHFKSVNDTYGHLCGDAILAAVGQRIRDILRNTDTKCRYGGEEFMVMLPDTPRPGALHVAESLRAQLAEVSVTWNGERVSLTASVGLAMAMAKEVDPIPLIGRADAALYRAKNGGRNRVCETESPSEPQVAPKAV